MHLHALGEPIPMNRSEDTDFTPEDQDHYRLIDPLEDYLLAKSKANGSGNYRRNAERVIQNWLEFTAERRDTNTFEALRPSDLEAYALHLKRRASASDGIAASTARKYYDYVRAYLSWCAAREYTIDNPAATDRASEVLPDDDQRNTHRQQLWSSEQRQAIIEYVDQRAREAIEEQGLNAIKEIRDRAFVAMIAYAGVRGGEIVRDPNDARREGVQWHDVSFENGTMFVLDKGDQEYREVGIPRQALTTLERYQQVLNPPSEDWPVFPTFHPPTQIQTARNGLLEDGFSDEEIDEILDELSTKEILREYNYPPPAITTDGARRLMKRLSANAKIPDLDTESGEYLELHGGRRGAGDTLVREIGWETAQRLLRHKSPETTMESYSHISASEVADDAESAFDQADC